MFDMSKLGDMAKIAGEARKVQQSQERVQRDQIDILKKISKQLEDLTNYLKKNNR